MWLWKAQEQAAQALTGQAEARPIPRIKSASAQRRIAIFFQPLRSLASRARDRHCAQRGDLRAGGLSITNYSIPNRTATRMPSWCENARAVQEIRGTQLKWSLMMGPLHTYIVLAVNSFSGVGKSRGLENSFQVSENQTVRQGPCHAMENSPSP